MKSRFSIGKTGIAGVTSLLAALVLVTACQGTLGDPRGDDSFIDSKTGQLAACDPSKYTSVSITDIQSDFVAHVQPYLTDSSQGCISCHSDNSGRNFITTPEGSETFFRSWVNNFLQNQPGSMLARMQSIDDKLRMPQGGPAWSVVQQAPLARVMCKLQGYAQAGGAAADEQFPTYLLDSYSGANPNYYDNTFINYPQLKGKVKAIFNDTWVRSGQDQFLAHVGALGGADFKTQFTEARAATSDFLLAMDQLTADVCTTAVTNKTGPFASINTTQAVIDEPASATQTFQAEASSVVKSSGGGQAVSNPSGYEFYGNGNFSTPVVFPGNARSNYTITLRAKGTSANDATDEMSPEAGKLHYPEINVLIDGVVAYSNLEIANTSYANFTVDVSVQPGSHTVVLAYVNDSPTEAGTGDRTFYLDYFTVAGPDAGGTGTSDQTSARANIDTLYQKILFHPPSKSEEDGAYSLLSDLSRQTVPADGWSALCEGLMKHPDFLFTLPPTRAAATDTDLRKQLLLVKVAQDLLARPPTASELTEVTTGGKTIDQMVDQFLTAPEFTNYFFYRMQIRTQSDGSTLGDEPARLWTYLMLSGGPFGQLLNGDYTVDTQFHKASRDASHGASGVLTMPGYIQYKPGLPHYNYSARVLQDFMGYVFQVPDAVIAMRLGATASSTVDPNSICFACHQLLTPLATQRLAWDDDGNYRTVDDNGAPIDDTDRNMVPSYPYKGKGMAAFGAQAVRKERFVRQTLNAEYLFLFGRTMRYDQDERGVYKELWDVQASTHGDLRATLKAMINSPAYTGP